MTDIWFISDTHFFHDNILRFTDDDGTPIRGKLFKNADEMNAAILENWNRVVKPQDKVYHLGDVGVGVRNQDSFRVLLRGLNGHKRLLLGNHDHLESPAYRAFERIELWTGGKFKKDNFVASHIPLRTDQMRDGEFNVHGHTHQNLVKLNKHHIDPRYINVCVEHTNYTPVHMDELKARMK